MDKRLTFNEDVLNYEKWRPIYCNELFSDIINYSGLNENKKALEIGIGTGQATNPFLLTNCNLKAIELGKELAEFSKEKFKEFDKFEIENVLFEDFKAKDNSFDLIYSATAFHWISEDIGYSKIYKLLKKNGCLALFWNKPFVARKDNELHQKIQKIYQKYRPSNKKMIEYDEERYMRISTTIQKYGFNEVTTKLYHKTRSFNSKDYIALLNTYSDHRLMDENVKVKFENEIKNVILDYGDILTVYDTIDLYLARK